jgi:hypothetical protein
MALAIAPFGARAQSNGIMELVQEPNPLLLHTAGSQGYLGVDVADVDQDKAQSLKLKEVRGAIITLIDHDAPAGQIGLKVNDVVIQLNGQDIEGAEQLRRMLREIPAGRKVSLEISRDGNVQTLAVQLADRLAMEHEVWNNIGKGGDVFAQSPTGMGILNGEGDASLPGAFRMPIFGSTLNVGAIVEPLTTQMAEYLGVANGLMVKQVARKSEAAAAGLKAFDVILKVGSDTISNLSSWDRALHANQGKPVQVTILRDKKQQTITLQVDSKHKGELERENIFSDDDCPLLALADPNLPQLFAWQDADSATARALSEKASGIAQFEIIPQDAEQMRKQAEALRDQLNSKAFQFDRKQLDELKQQMDEFRKNFKPEDFKRNRKQLEEPQRQMEQFRNDDQPQLLGIARL